MEVVGTSDELRARVIAWRRTGARIALVPVVGGLHLGHLAVTRAARARGERVIAALCDAEPASAEAALWPQPRRRDRTGDVATLSAEGADLVFAPEPAALFPHGHATRILVRRFDDVLSGVTQQARFDGFMLLVTKLMNITQPDTILFGADEWQVMLLARTLVRDLDLAVEVVVCDPAREGDGLAASTENRLLSRAERALAPRLFAEITDAARRISQGAPSELACAEAAEALIVAGFREVEYLECRHAETLRVVPSPGRNARVFAAVRLGEVRLTDNVPVPVPPGG